VSVASARIDQCSVSECLDAAHNRLLYTANADGGWGQTPSSYRSDPISTAYALLALARTHRQSNIVTAAIEYLRDPGRRWRLPFAARPVRIAPTPDEHSDCIRTCAASATRSTRPPRNRRQRSTVPDCSDGEPRPGVDSRRDG